MATNSQLRTTEDALLLALQALLAKRTALNLAAVLISSLEPEDLPIFQADQFLALRLGSSTPVQAVIDGGGRVDGTERVQLEVTILTRCLLDDAPQDTARLTDAALGHYKFRSAVVDALQIDLLEDANFNSPVFEPVRVLSRSRPRRHKVDGDWAWSIVVFDVPFLMALDQSRQG